VSARAARPIPTHATIRLAARAVRLRCRVVEDFEVGSARVSGLA
jgi:hypothetical protein